MFVLKFGKAKQFVLGHNFAGGVSITISDVFFSGCNTVDRANSHRSLDGINNRVYVDTIELSTFFSYRSYMVRIWCVTEGANQR